MANHYDDRPAWYIGRKTLPCGDYFGSVASIAPRETYVTQDLKYIVHRDPISGQFSVSRNACAHAGAQLLSKAGVQDRSQFRCPVHKWLYRPTGELLKAPYMENCDHIRLHAPLTGMWNGYLLGHEQEHLDVAMQNFGEQLGVPKSAFNPGEFVFMAEEAYDMPYPKELMMANYLDGYHVPLFHQQTFAAVADADTYRWEFSDLSKTGLAGYSLQEVCALPSNKVHSTLEAFTARGTAEESVGWASLHLWLQKELHSQGMTTPIDPQIFALWLTIYGHGYLMPELYEGGIFLAVSYLVSVDPKNPETGNSNYVEYYVHKNVPEQHRHEAYRRFKQAYEQSAREDDDICNRLWAAHRQGDMDFKRLYHPTLEQGDMHWRQWFNARFEVK